MDSREIGCGRSETREDRTAKRDNTFKDLFGGLADDDLLASDQRQDGIRGIFHGLNEVAVDDKRLVVEPGELDHRVSRAAQVCARVRLHNGLSAGERGGLRERSTGEANLKFFFWSQSCRFEIGWMRREPMGGSWRRSALC